MKALVVTNPFGPYVLGDHIKDPGKITEILDSHNSGHVVSVEILEGSPPTEPKTKVLTEQTP